ncbi:hypothetical protein KIH39_16050 [Telmatocola sphagniphila]|uniref:Uncharacterized protein n=1 Tax=Telmatocola sphagniphila TaxID=1123043 RepID=A0A8E6B297_9BACT|nr:hypothetical protein [Telmatocola sphagniphila]QVL30361.1 hypothetical protein KIH39_16050 [Telmatocola sphagniphila]
MGKRKEELSSPCTEIDEMKAKSPLWYLIPLKKDQLIKYEDKFNGKYSDQGEWVKAMQLAEDNSFRDRTFNELKDAKSSAMSWLLYRYCKRMGVESKSLLRKHIAEDELTFFNFLHCDRALCALDSDWYFDSLRIKKYSNFIRNAPNDDTMNLLYGETLEIKNYEILEEICRRFLLDDKVNVSPETWNRSTVILDLKRLSEEKHSKRFDNFAEELATVKSRYVNDAVKFQFAVLESQKKRK